MMFFFFFLARLYCLLYNAEGPGAWSGHPGRAEWRRREGDEMRCDGDARACNVMTQLRINEAGVEWG